MVDAGLYVFSITDVRLVGERLSLAVQDFAPDFPPAEYKIGRTKRGKPFFEGIPLKLSISHSGRWWVLALAYDEIGVDVQEMRAVRYEALARRFFHPQEVNELEKSGFDDFYRIWTRKESYVKLTGAGIDAHFREFSVFTVSAAFQEVWLEKGYVLTICTREPAAVQLKYL